MDLNSGLEAAHTKTMATRITIHETLHAKASQWLMTNLGGRLTEGLTEMYATMVHGKTGFENEEKKLQFTPGYEPLVREAFHFHRMAGKKLATHIYFRGTQREVRAAKATYDKLKEKYSLKDTLGEESEKIQLEFQQEYNKHLNPNGNKPAASSE